MSHQKILLRRNTKTAQLLRSTLVSVLLARTGARGPRGDLIAKIIVQDLIVPADFVKLAHEFEIAAGREVTIESDGEVLCL